MGNYVSLAYWVKCVVYSLNEVCILWVIKPVLFLYTEWIVYMLMRDSGLIHLVLGLISLSHLISYPINIYPCITTANCHRFWFFLQIWSTISFCLCVLLCAKIDSMALNRGRLRVSTTSSYMKHSRRTPRPWIMLYRLTTSTRAFKRPSLSTTSKWKGSSCIVSQIQL